MYKRCPEPARRERSAGRERLRECSSHATNLAKTEHRGREGAQSGGGPQWEKQYRLRVRKMTGKKGKRRWKNARREKDKQGPG